MRKAGCLELPLRNRLAGRTALGMIGAEIYASGSRRSGKLFWDKPGDGYGFPVAPTLRDPLQGDDAKYL